MRDTPSHASNHVYLIKKESILNGIEMESLFTVPNHVRCVFSVNITYVPELNGNRAYAADIHPLPTHFWHIMA